MTTNTENKETKKEKKFPVVEIFGPVVEGEGKLIGTQTMFIRFGLCDFKCTKCDSMHAVDPKLVKAGAAWLTAEEILSGVMALQSSVGAHHIQNITFSGGNPAIHELSELVYMLKKEGYNIFVETQGTKFPTWMNHVDEIVVSPKSPGMGEKFDPEVFKGFFEAAMQGQAALSVKIVIFADMDIEFAAGVSSLIQHWLETEEQYTRSTNFSMASSFYLSLGNPYPPVFEIQPANEGGAPEVVQVEEDNKKSINDNKNSLVVSLLSRYNILCDAVMKDHRLAHAKFLPQLHVLLFGNETGR